jgi:hypothetical protein
VSASVVGPMAGPGGQVSISQGVRLAPIGGQATGNPDRRRRYRVAASLDVNGSGTSCSTGGML